MITKKHLAITILITTYIMLSLFLMISHPVQAAFPGFNGNIAFHSTRGGDFEIYVMDSRGESFGITQLTFNTANDVDPDWSPDGGRIALHNNQIDPANYEIHVMNSTDGSNLQRLTNNMADDRNAAWSPDEEKMTFASDRDGNFEIFVMDADGESQGLSKLTSTTDVENYGPNWQASTIKKIEDIKSIVADTSEIPVSDFDGANNRVKDNRRNALLNMLDEVVTDIKAAMASADPTVQKAAYKNATNQLNSILDKTDGCSERGTPDTKNSGYTPDWITTCASQAKIDPPIRELVTMVQTLLAQIP